MAAQMQILTWGGLGWWGNREGKDKFAPKDLLIQKINLKA